MAEAGLQLRPPRGTRVEFRPPGSLQVAPMGYVDSNLARDERVLYRAHLHWVLFFSWKSLFTLFLAPLLQRWSSEFAVTNRRVIIKLGLVSRETLELSLSKVESIGVDQTLLGRILGYGTIIVIGTGGTRERFDKISNPLGFRRAVMDAFESAAPGS